MESLIDTIRNFGVPRLTALIGSVAVMLGLVVFLVVSGSRQELALLYSDLDPQTANQIADQLASRQVDYSLSNDQTRISVPRDQVGQLRLEFAEQGLSGTVGYDIFDRDQSLGQSSFTQEVNRLRALEGELSRTIASLENVRGARVHIVLPRRQVFTREPQEATASVVVKMRGATRLDRNRTSAIQQLVATAVPQLEAQRISIIDDRGTLLHGGDSVEDGLGPNTIADMQTGFESRMSDKVTDMLEKVIGVGKVRVEVSAEMNFAQEVQNIQSYDPEQQVLVSSREVENSEQSNEAGADAVTVGNNLPGGGGLDGQGTTTEVRSSTDTVNNFQTGNTRTERIVPAGEVERLSVAVVVDGIRLEDGTYQGREDAEMEVLRDLVESAVGLDRSRGDQVTIHNLRFEDVPVFAALEDERYFGFPISELTSLAQTLMVIFSLAVVVLLFVRPLVNRLIEAQQQAAAARAAADQPTMITDQSGAPVPTQMVAAPDGTMVPVPVEGSEEFEAMIDIANIEGRVKASSLKKIGEIIEKHPEEAVSILRNWMYQESG